MLTTLRDAPASRLVLTALLACIALLLLASVTANVLALEFDLYGVPWVGGMVRMLNVNEERNVPSWFSSDLLAGAGVVALMAAALSIKHGAPWRFQWATIGLLFFLLSLDETASFHEMASAPVRNALGIGGILYFAWVIPGAAFVLLLAVIFLPFVLALPRGVRLWVIVSAGTFVAGALGFETLGSLERQHDGTIQTFAYMALSTCEEGLEMVGVALFIAAVLRYIELTFPLGKTAS